jgi:putative colanic acid biosynthesis glycosyltransferase
MPRILQITIDGNAGSTGRIAEAIGKKAMARGWESSIVYGRFARQSESQIIKIGSNIDIYLHGLQTRLFDRHGLGSKRATLVLVKQIKAVNPTVIHLHSLHGYYINIEILFNYLSNAKIPVIWTFHDCWSLTGHCAHFDFVGCDKWKTECHHCPQKKEYPASFFIDRSRKNYRLKKELFTSVSNMTVVSVSNWLSGVVLKSFMGNIPNQMIYNGIDVDFFKPVANQHKIKEKLNIGDGFMILGVSGIWGTKKGLYDFVDLSLRIGKNDFIVLVGLNKSQVRELPRNIIGITHTENQQELIDLYSIADVFLNLSVEETFGLTTVEAMACGTPTIVYNATACPEVVGDTGIIVNKNDINGLLDAIETVRKNGKAFYSAACRARAVKFFNKDDRFAEYIDLYERVLEDKKLRSFEDDAISASKPLNLSPSHSLTLSLEGIEEDKKGRSLEQ